MRQLFIFLVILLFSFGCKKKNEGSPGENEIWLQFKAYTPSQLVVKKGTTVSFISKDNSSHTVTQTASVFDSQTIKSGQSFSYTFDSIGTFNIYCKFHPTIATEQGAIVVQ